MCIFQPINTATDQMGLGLCLARNSSSDPNRYIYALSAAAILASTVAWIQSLKAFQPVVRFDLHVP
jgi:hypothetical protein